MELKGNVGTEERKKKRRERTDDEGESERGKVSDMSRERRVKEGGREDKMKVESGVKGSF